MFKIKLKNNKTFTCDKDLTIFEAAKKSNIVLEHSCLSSRCRSCLVKVLSGKTINKEEELVLTEEDKNNNLWISTFQGVSRFTKNDSDFLNFNSRLSNMWMNQFLRLIDKTWNK